MMYLSCYDDTDKAIQYLADKWDMSEPEVIDELLSIAAESDDDVATAISQSGI